jgi:pilus assembly protein CpaB
VLGGLAASDVAGREAALQQRQGAPVPVIVTRGAVSSGTALTPARLAVRLVPQRFAPPGAFRTASELDGLRAAGELPPGAFLTPAAVRDPAAESAAGAPVRPGERVADVVARAAPELITAGARVDVLVTRDGSGGRPGRTVLALQDVEVLSASGAAAADAGGANGGSGGDGGPRVAAALRVTPRQAVFLAAAQTFAREIRLLPRAPGDRGHLGSGLEETEGLR